MRSRFLFGPFVVSPGHRTLRQDDVDVALISRYFDLLVLLVAERHRVVTRQEIFERVWTDVVVSDGALSQAIRTIRRALGDDPREPRFIRTVSRQGYQFIGSDVREESDDRPLDIGASGHRGIGESDRVSETSAQGIGTSDHDIGASDPFERLLARLLRRPPFSQATDEERREAAEELHALDTTQALVRLDGRPGHAEARAILRDTRWDVPGGGEVAILGSPDPLKAVLHLVRLRIRRAGRHISNRWALAALGGSVAGALSGVVGGVALWWLPQSDAGPDVVVALAMIGAAAGALGAAGVGAGLAVAEALARSARTTGLVVCGALGGWVAGTVAHVAARALVSGVFGFSLPNIGGGLEGLALGAAAGLGYAASTGLHPGGGLAAPRGTARLKAALVTGAAAGLTGLLLALAGRPLVGATLDVMAAAFDGSGVGLAPIARLLGEDSLRPVTRAVVSAFEGLAFGAGLAFGVTHRPSLR